MKYFTCAIKLTMRPEMNSRVDRVARVAKSKKCFTGTIKLTMCADGTAGAELWVGAGVGTGCSPHLFGAPNLQTQLKLAALSFFFACE